MWDMNVKSFFSHTLHCVSNFSCNGRLSLAKRWLYRWPLSFLPPFSMITTVRGCKFRICSSWKFRRRYLGSKMYEYLEWDSSEGPTKVTCMECHSLLIKINTNDKGSIDQTKRTSHAWPKHCRVVFKWNINTALSEMHFPWMIFTGNDVDWNNIPKSHMRKWKYFSTKLTFLDDRYKYIHFPHSLFYCYLLCIFHSNLWLWLNVPRFDKKPK